MRIINGVETRGSIAAAISEAIVAIYREHTGKGPEQVKTYINDDAVFSVRRGSHTAAEHTLHRGGRDDLVREGRDALRDILRQELIGTVEQLTDRRVSAFLSTSHLDPDVAVDVWLFERDA
jgi:uncharacterized protein YbcI